MIFKLLDKITHEWQRPWALIWFVCGISALSWQFLVGTRSGFEGFKLIVAAIGMLCVLALAFRRNFSGNGLGITANVGEVIAQGGSGATGLMLTPLYNMFTHAYALGYWAKNQDGDGNMIPKKATGFVWLVTIVFIVVSLLLFPKINDQLQRFSFIEKSDDTALYFLGVAISWYQINVLAFVIAVTAQTTMILRYAFSWWLWIGSNFVWLAVNLVNHNAIFATQTIIYQINAFIGLYEWWTSSRTPAFRKIRQGENLHSS